MEFLLEYFTNPNKRVFWLYLFSSFFIAMIYLFFNQREAKINLSKKLWLNPSAILDYKYFLISSIIKIALITPIVISSKEIALATYRFLDESFGYFRIELNFSLIIFLYTISLFLLSDFSRYWLHRFLHLVPFLWKFHRVHHSAKVLTPITFYRIHPLENILFGFRYSIVIGSVTGVFIYLFGAIDIYSILGVNIFLFIFSLLGSNLRHSHIKLKYPSFLEKILISPYQHQIHHSQNYTHKNFGGYLAIWDYLFGTLKESKETEKIKFGLKNYNDFNLIDLLIKPFYLRSKQ